MRLNQKEQARFAYSEVLTLAEQLLEQPVATAEIYVERSQAFYYLHRYEEALTACEQAIHLDPDLAMTYSNKGNANNYEKAYIMTPYIITEFLSLVFHYSDFSFMSQHS